MQRHDKSCLVFYYFIFTLHLPTAAESSNLTLNSLALVKRHTGKCRKSLADVKADVAIWGKFSTRKTIYIRSAILASTKHYRLMIHISVSLSKGGFFHQVFSLSQSWGTKELLEFPRSPDQCLFSKKKKVFAHISKLLITSQKIWIPYRVSYYHGVSINQQSHALDSLSLSFSSLSQRHFCFNRIWQLI